MSTTPTSNMYSTLQQNNVRFSEKSQTEKRTKLFKSKSGQKQFKTKSTGKNIKNNGASPAIIDVSTKRDIEQM